MDVQESAVFGVPTASKFDPGSSADGGIVKEFNNSRFHNRITDFETEHPVLNEALNTSIPKKTQSSSNSACSGEIQHL
jgi:hypothetical protein